MKFDLGVQKEQEILMVGSSQVVQLGDKPVRLRQVKEVIELSERLGVDPPRFGWISNEREAGEMLRWLRLAVLEKDRVNDGEVKGRRSSS